MAKTGKERVVACLKFERPDRTPRDLWTLPYVNAFQNDDLKRLLSEYPTDITGTSETGTTDKLVADTRKIGSYKDDWGSVWHVAEPGVVGEVKEPAIVTWQDLKNFSPPRHIIGARDREKINRACGLTDKFVLSDVTARPFERLQFLRGTENLFLDLAYGTEELQKLIKMVHEFYLEDITFWCKTSVDGITMMDDWGTAISLLINPHLWKTLFYPLYREYCELIHSYGKYTFFHSDGHIEKIFPGLVEVGFDAINCQLFTMDTERLLKTYRGKITFWGEIDRQYVLPFGTLSDVREAVLKVRRILEDGSGGVIAQCEWGKNNSYENIKQVYATWAEKEFQPRKSLQI